MRIYEKIIFICNPLWETFFSSNDSLLAPFTLPLSKARFWPTFNILGLISHTNIWVSSCKLSSRTSCVALLFTLFKVSRIRKATSPAKLQKIKTQDKQTLFMQDIKTRINLDCTITNKIQFALDKDFYVVAKEFNSILQLLYDEAQEFTNLLTFQNDKLSSLVYL